MARTLCTTLPREHRCWPDARAQGHLLQICGGQGHEDCEALPISFQSFCAPVPARCLCRWQAQACARGGVCQDGKGPRLTKRPYSDRRAKLVSRWRRWRAYSFEAHATAWPICCNGSRPWQRRLGSSDSVEPAGGQLKWTSPGVDLRELRLSEYDEDIIGGLQERLAR